MQSPGRILGHQQITQNGDTVLLLSALVLALHGDRIIDFTGAGGVKLQGTFTAAEPHTKGPAVLLLPGSGPTDRDGNQPPMLTTDLLKSIADKLSKSGVSSFRFDKRAAHVYASNWPKGAEALNQYFSWENLVGDAEAAFAVLKKQPEVDSAKAGILGHSEGGLITLQMSANQKPAFLILVGTPYRGMADVIRGQISDALKSQGATKPIYDQYMGITNGAIKEITDKGTVPKDIPAGLVALFNPTVAKLLQSYFKLDVPALATAYPGPVLVVNGEFDSQVSAELDAKPLAAALQKRKATKAKLFIAPKASHNLKTVAGNKEPGFVGAPNAEALQEIAVWAKSGG